MIYYSSAMENRRHTCYDLSPSLTEVLRLLFGPAWRRRACAVFGRSRRQIGRWCSGETRVPRWVIREIERRTLAAAANLERWKQEQIERIEKEEARERLAATGQALTWVKLLRIRDKREPMPRVGRPRKRSPIVRA
jgi:hypothetical protein